MFKHNSEYYCISATRFNDITWDENVSYRKNRKLKGCIYGVSKQIGNSITNNSILFVFEMNNSKPSQIMGMGIIRNNNKHYSQKIHSNINYNRFCYFSKYRLDRSYLLEHHKDILELTEKIVFKGKDHIKRGTGISQLPSKKMKSHRETYFEFIKTIAKNILMKD